VRRPFVRLAHRHAPTSCTPVHAPHSPAALVHPYESRLLNVLDVGSLLVLVFTQILSIVYLYLDNLQSAQPLGLERATIEVGITVLLFAANVSVIATLLCAWIARLAYEKLTAKRRTAKQAAHARLEAGSEIEMHNVALRLSLHAGSFSPTALDATVAAQLTCAPAAADVARPRTRDQSRQRLGSPGLPDPELASPRAGRPREGGATAPLGPRAWSSWIVGAGEEDGGNHGDGLSAAAKGGDASVGGEVAEAAAAEPSLLGTANAQLRSEIARLAAENALIKGRLKTKALSCAQLAEENRRLIAREEPSSVVTRCAISFPSGAPVAGEGYDDLDTAAPPHGADSTPALRSIKSRFGMALSELSGSSEDDEVATLHHPMRTSAQGTYAI
jgi:hypothetical protein